MGRELDRQRHHERRREAQWRKRERHRETEQRKSDDRAQKPVQKGHGGRPTALCMREGGDDRGQHRKSVEQTAQRGTEPARKARQYEDQRGGRNETGGEITPRPHGRLRGGHQAGKSAAAEHRGDHERQETRDQRWLKAVQNEDRGRVRRPANRYARVPRQRDAAAPVRHRKGDRGDQTRKGGVRGLGREDIALLQESIARMHACIRDSEVFREEARRFMTLVATASGNRVLAILVDALHRMSEGAGADWDEKQRRSALRSYETFIQKIESGETEEARSVMEKSLVAAARYWERTAPDELKQPVAWIDSDH